MSKRYILLGTVHSLIRLHCAHLTACMQDARKDSSAQAPMDALHLATEVCYLNCQSHCVHCQMQSVCSFDDNSVHRLPLCIWLAFS